ncbi:MAG: penicillin-binding protein activator [Desulfuromonadales bacterium]|nr:penicillin-binding protein activator [Desulfuromonadales bacterium]
MLMRKRQLIRTLLFGLLTLLLILPPFLYAAAPVDNRSLGAAMRSYAEGDYAAALPQLLSLLETADEVTPMIDARLAVASIYRQKGQNDAALAQISQIPATLRNDQSRLIEGLILLEIGLFDESVATFKRIDEQALSAEDRETLLVSLARGSAGQRELFPALWFAHRALSTTMSPERENAVFSLVMELLKSAEAEQKLPEIAFMFAGTPIGAAASILLIEQSLDSGSLELARARIHQVDIGLIPGDFRNSAIALFTRLTGESWLQRSVGVVLPFSGKYSVYGEFVRRGMELALEGAVNATGVRFLFYDGAADAAKSREAVRTLVRSEKVVAVTGAITGAAAMAIAEQAQSEQVPLLTLAQSNGLPEVGPYIFRNSLTARQQVETLARYAVLDQGLTSFAILSPENRLGESMADLFTEEVEKLGAEVIVAQQYDETATDFGRQIKRLKGENPNRGKMVLTGKALLLDLFVPDPPPFEFEALFIPDYADKIGVIAPQLAYYGIENVPLLGINGWNSPDLLRTVGGFIEGAVFVDGFFAYSPYPFVKEFVDLYYAKYGEIPTFLQAQGYDAASILLALLDNPDIRTRNDLRLALSQLQAYPGVTGATTFNWSGEAEKILYLLQVRNGNIEQINNLIEVGSPGSTIDALINGQLIHE